VLAGRGFAGVGARCLAVDRRRAAGASGRALPSSAISASAVTQTGVWSVPRA
jgi:hypothetical protein